MKAYLGLGSNLTDRLSFLKKAVDLIDSLPQVQVLRVSSVYETEPVQCAGGWFYNLVLEAEFFVSTSSFMRSLLKIETRIGRKRRGPQEARVIDIDFLFAEGEILQTEDLVLPHPRLHERRFVLEPLAELNPNFKHPVLEQTVSAMLQNLKDPGAVRKLFVFRDALISQGIV